MVNTPILICSKKSLLGVKTNKKNRKYNPLEHSTIDLYWIGLYALNLKQEMCEK